MTVSFPEIKKIARGRWVDILSRFGIYVKTDGKHGPCPICGGKDRFRFDDKDGDGTWYCNQGHNGKNAGDGFSLIAYKQGISNADAFQEVAQFLGLKVNKTIPTLPTTPHHVKILQESQELYPTDPAGQYLLRRGLWIPESTNVLRYHPGLYERTARRKRPCLVAIVKRDGKAIGVHRIWPEFKMYPKVKRLSRLDGGTYNGGAVEIMPLESSIMGVAEGVETAMACCKLFGMPVWSTISTSGMKSFVPPKQIQTLHIFGDSDLSCAGHLAAYTLKGNLSKKAPWVNCMVHIPAKPGCDWLDIYFNLYGGDEMTEARKIEHDKKAIDILVAELMACKTLADINRVGKKGKKKLKSDFYRNEWVEMARKAWYKVKEKGGRIA